MSVEKDDSSDTATGASGLRLKAGLRVEEIEDEAIVFDPNGRRLHRVTGEGIEALELLAGGIRPADVPGHLASSVDELVAADVVEGTSRWTRRRALLTGGIAFTAATVTTFALADPAAAMTACPDGSTAPDSGSAGNRYTTPGTFPFKTGVTDTTLFVRLWGAGGGGGGSATVGTAGGGGGGGAYVDGNVTVAGCSSYSLTVGTGGQGGRKSNWPYHQSGAAGSPSSFSGISSLSAPGGSGGNFANGGGSGGVGSGGTTNRTGGSGGSGRGLFGNYQSGGGGGGAGSGSNGSNGANGGNGGNGGSGVTVEGFSTAGGKGGNYAYNNNGNGGTAPGGGGGGAGVQGGGDGWIGGNGARGQVWVRV